MGSRKDFEIKKRESFRHGILRILDTLHKSSSKLIVAGSRRHISIHELRKNIKKIRGILRLIRHEIGHEKYHELNDYYKDLAHKVAVLRDDTSQIELLNSMQKKVNKADIKRTFSKAIRQVEKKRKLEFERFKNESKQNIVKDLIEKQAANIHKLEIFGDPDYFILKSLKRIHCRARSAYEVTGFLKNEEIYHYLRKQVKYLMYHLMILNVAWPSYFKTYINELDKLNILTGKLHDLGLFNNHIHEKKLITLNETQKSETLNFIYKRRALLKKRIAKTGERIFNESSEAFANRVHEIWTNNL